MATRATHAAARSACGPSPAASGQRSGRPPRTLSTMIFRGQGLASSRSPISRTWRIAPTKSPPYGTSRRRTFRSRRAVLPIAPRSGGLRPRRLRAETERPKRDAAGDDVERVVQDASEPDVLGDDDTQGHDAERGADAGHLRDPERK